VHAEAPTPSRLAAPYHSLPAQAPANPGAPPGAVASGPPRRRYRAKVMYLETDEYRIFDVESCTWLNANEDAYDKSFELSGRTWHRQAVLEVREL